MEDHWLLATSLSKHQAAGRTGDVVLQFDCVSPYGDDTIAAANLLTLARHMELLTLAGDHGRA